MIKNNEIKHIIDIRTKFEYDLGNYPGSIPYQLMKLLKKLLRNLIKMTTY